VQLNNVLQISGASAFDACFELDLPGIPHFVWNTTKLEADCFKGKFGPPVKMKLSDIPPMDAASWENVNIPKVQRIVLNAGEIISLPDWDYDGERQHKRRLIDTPAIRVIFEYDGVYHGIFVDGNHRLAARTLLACEYIECFEVPPELEGAYRIQFKEL
jgi:hypothetical protein